MILYMVNYYQGILAIISLAYKQILKNKLILQMTKLYLTKKI